MKLIKGIAVSLACWGVVFPQAGAMAANPQHTPVVDTVKAPAAVDVALGPGGTFSGQVVNAQGIGIDGAVVSVRQLDKVVAQTVSDREGRFTLTNLRGGTYEVVAGHGQQVSRFWAPETAPPAARSSLVLVSDEQVTRGQFFDGFGGSPLLTLGVGGLAVGSLVLGIINHNKLDHIHDDIERLANSP